MAFLLHAARALSTNSWGQLSGGLRIVNAEGIEFTRLNNVNGTAIAWGAEPISSAEWIFHDIPAFAPEILPSQNHVRPQAQALLREAMPGFAEG